jgi:hypothetical protein
MINFMTASSSSQQSGLSVLPLQWVRDRVNQVDVNNPKTAQLICKLVPPSCPFQRTIKLFGKPLLVIPPLCHFNPVYEELMALRFRALTFLSENNQEYYSNLNG